MAKTKKEKKALADSYSQKITQSKGFIVIKPSELTPNETNEFRKNLYDAKADFHVVKNTIFKFALKNNNLPEFESLENGENAVLFLQEDFVQPSKALKALVENLKTKSGDAKIQIIAGMLDGEKLTDTQVSELAEMPDKKGSVAMILGILDNALSGVLNVLEDAPRSYASILDQAFKE
jgi:large subunit ribosomal protein L10